MFLTSLTRLHRDYYKYISVEQEDGLRRRDEWRRKGWRADGVHPQHDRCRQNLETSQKRQNPRAKFVLQDDPEYSSTSNGEQTTERKRTVRFDESAAAKRDPASSKRKDPRKVGKANPCRDLCLLVGVIGFLLLITSGWKPTKTEKEKPKGMDKMSLSDILQQRAKEVLSGARTDPCAMFLHSGSIPGTGWSYFAGQDYAEGDLLLESSLLLPLDHDDDDDEPMMVPPYALLIKHHPVLANAGGPLYTSSSSSSSSPFQLRATRSIAVGEEIFVAFDGTLHEHPWFSESIPSVADYQIATAIIADMIGTANTNKKKTNTALVFNLLRRSVAKLNPRIASLIPDNIRTTSDYDTNEPSYLAALKNHTLSSLQIQATCASDVVVTTANGGASSSSWTTTRSFQKGDVLGTAPVHVRQLPPSATTCNNNDSENEECRRASSPRWYPCYGHTRGSALFCPLEIPLEPPISSGGDRSSAPPNVEFRWRETSMLGMPLQELQLPSKMAAWDLVATENIAKGDEVSTKLRVIIGRSTIHKLTYRTLLFLFAYFTTLAAAHE